MSLLGRRACGIDITNNCRPERLSQESVHSKLPTDVVDKLWRIGGREREGLLSLPFPLSLSFSLSRVLSIPVPKRRGEGRCMYTPSTCRTDRRCRRRRRRVFRPQRSRSHRARAFYEKHRNAMRSPVPMRANETNVNRYRSRFSRLSERASKSDSHVCGIKCRIDLNVRSL